MIANDNIKLYGLHEILDFKEIEELFKHFSVTTGLDVALYDSTGYVKLKNNSDNICRLAKNQKICRQNITYGAEKARQLKEPYIYTCGCGLVMCSFPVIFNKELIGSVVCGPAMLWDADDYARNELDKNITEMALDQSVDLCSITQLSCQSLTSAARILHILVNHICKNQQERIRQNLEIAVQKSTIIELIEQSSQSVQECLNSYPSDLEKKLITYVQLGEKNKAREIINNYLGNMFLYAQGNLEIIKAKLYEFTAFLSRAAVEAGAPLSSMLNSIKDSATLLSENTEFSDVCSITIKILYDFIDKVYGSRGKKSGSSHLQNAIDYINNRYNEEISLDSLSKAVFVSSYYLSHLFREELNTTFSDYLNKIRIDKAKKILDGENIKIEELSGRVGFNNTNYFTKIFKKHIGISPAHYKKFVKKY